MASSPQHDAIVIGAGVCGIYMLHRLRRMGMDAIALDKAAGPGGTWYWNRYPGARFDSESYSYGYSFDPEILQEWSWSEHFAAQPETLRYLNYVVDKLNLRAHMHFSRHVQALVYDETANLWQVELADGDTMTCRYVMSAVGMLSAATLPRIEGRESFLGQAFHTYNWPHEPVTFTDKRVAVIGTGATGVQVIGAIAPQVGSLTVFQRRPNWCAPLHNSPIDDATQAEIKASYDKIFARCAVTPGGFLHGPVRQVVAEVDEDERHAFWEKLYASPGFGVWLGNYRDVLLDGEANALYSEFIANKIRQRVHDPETAEKLIPKDHGFGARRVPMETHYYEAYNQDNVRLVDLNETPITRIVPTGIETSDELHEFDIIIYATGFDAITGSYDRMEIRGVGGMSLADKWRAGPQTYLGMQVAGFPNLFTLAGPQGASVATNFPPAIETAVNWVADLVERMNDEGLEYVEARPEAEVEWNREVEASYQGLVLNGVKSWFTGYNSNVDGHDQIRHLLFLGGAPQYRSRLDDVAANGFAGFTLR